MGSYGVQPLGGWRNESCVIAITVPGLDLSGIPVRAQVRPSADNPVLLLDLEPTNDPSATGIRFVGVTFDAAGIPTSNLMWQVSKPSMQGLPYVGEVGDAWVGTYALQIAGTTRMVGQFAALASAIDADAAPANRAPGWGGPSSGALVGGVTLTISGGGLMVAVSAADLLPPLVAATQRAAAEAAAAQAGAGASAVIAQKGATDSAAYLAGVQKAVSGSGPIAGALTVQASSRDVMAAIAAPAAGTQAMLGGSDSGLFQFVTGDQSALVAADPGQAMIVPPAATPTGAGGVWARAKSPAREFDLSWWLQGRTGGDQTIPMQQAVNRALQEGVATILLPGVHAPPGNLALPTDRPNGCQRSLTFRGKGQPPLGFGTVDGTLGVDQMATSAIDCSGLGARGLFNTSAYGNADAYGFVEIRMENLAIFREDNPAGPGIDGRFLGALYLDGVYVNTRRYTTKVVQPTNVGATGIIFPEIGNAASVWARGNVSVQGFYTGVRAGEHLAQDGLLTVSGCWIALEVPDLNDPVRLGSFSEFNNHISVSCSAVRGDINSHLEIKMWDRERKIVSDTGPDWQKTQWDVWDPNNRLVGEVGYHTVIQNLGPSNMLPLRNGGAGLIYRNLRKIARPFFQVRADPTPVPDGGNPTVVTFKTSINDNDMGIQPSDGGRAGQLPTQVISVEWDGWYDVDALVTFSGATAGAVLLNLLVDGAVYTQDARPVLPGLNSTCRIVGRIFLNRGQTVGMSLYKVGVAGDVVTASFTGGGPRLQLSLT